MTEVNKSKAEVIGIEYADREIIFEEGRDDDYFLDMVSDWYWTGRYGRHPAYQYVPPERVATAAMRDFIEWCVECGLCPTEQNYEQFMTRVVFEWDDAFFYTLELSGHIRRIYRS